MTPSKLTIGIWFASLALSCATQGGAQRPANGIGVLITDQVKCRTDGAAKAAASDPAEMCKRLVSDLKSELGRAGFTVVDDKSQTHALDLRLSGVETQPGGGDPATLTVEMRVDSEGQEIEATSQTSPSEVRDVAARSVAVARALADDLATSPRIRKGLAGH
jgi:hypothetical protein